MIVLVTLLIFTIAMTLITNMNVLHADGNEQHDNNEGEVPESPHSSVPDDERHERDANIQDQGNQDSEPTGQGMVGRDAREFSGNGSVESLSDVVEDTLLQFRKERSYYQGCPNLRNTDLWALRNRIVHAVQQQLGKIEREYVTTLEQELQESRAEVAYLKTQVAMDETDQLEELDRAYSTIILLLREHCAKGHAEFTDSQYEGVSGHVNIKHEDDTTILQYERKK